MESINVIEALEYLNNKYIVFTIDNNKKIFFKIINESIKVNTGNAFYDISKEDFLSYYKEFLFFIVEDNSFEVSKEKDEEYYGFKHK